MSSLLRTHQSRLRREGEYIGFTVCIQYADYLSSTLPFNRKFFKKFYIVTEAEDTATIDLAKKYDCTILFTRLKTASGAIFNKSGMVYEAQKIIHATHPGDWIVILDADIALDTTFEKVKTADLDAHALYGMQRCIFETKDDLEHSRAVIRTTKNIDGYFQMYWNKAKYYPKWSRDCSECDTVFSHMFSIHHQLKQTKCSHLGPTHINWNGRVSETWA